MSALTLLLKTSSFQGEVNNGTMKKFSHIFGPVPSRRFGRSLGVDLTPYKTCTLDCIYCQLGPTTRKTMERKSWVNLNAVEAELHFWLRAGGTADYITLSGSGEPTLHAEFGNALEFIRTHTSIPAVLLTNGTLMSHPDVRSAACKADVVKITLSAWEQDGFERIHRPHQLIKFKKMISGIKQFRNEFTGKMWIEVFLLEGINEELKNGEKIAALARQIEPDQIHLNTVVRPPGTKEACPVPKDRLVKLSTLFTPKATVITEFQSDHCSDMRYNEMVLLDMLRRRPCTTTQIATAFGMHPNEVAKYTSRLIRTGRIESVYEGADIYFQTVV